MRSCLLAIKVLADSASLLPRGRNQGPFGARYCDSRIDTLKS